MVDNPDRPPSTNPFIRFKNSVDNTVRRGLDTISYKDHESTTTDQEQSKHLSSSSSSEPAAESHSQATRPKQPVSTGVRLIALDSFAPIPPTSNMSSGSAGSQAVGPANHYDNYADPESWARHSPYSPFNLQHLPQPIPRDIPQEAGSNDFTFRDAFEDLMLVSSGRSMPKGPELMASKLHVDFMFANGMPVSNWVRNLEVRGLWKPYFPRQQRLYSWENEVASMLDGWGIDAGWLSGVFSEQIHPLLEKFQQDSAATGTDDVGERSKQPEDKGRYPETEQDLYGRPEATSRENKTPRYQSPWDMMVEALNEARTSLPHLDTPTTTVARTDDEGKSHSAPKETEKTESRKTWDGGRVDKVWKTREHNGRVETTETRYRYDADGNLISQWESTKVKTMPVTTGFDSGDEGYSSSSSSSRWSRTWTLGNGDRGRWDSDNEESRGTERSGTNEPSAGTDDKRQQRPSGWFWTK